MPRQGHCDERGARERTAHIPGGGSEGPRVPTARFLAAMSTHEASVRLVAAIMEVWYKKWRDDDGGPGQADVEPRAMLRVARDGRRKDGVGEDASRVGEESKQAKQASKQSKQASAGAAAVEKKGSTRERQRVAGVRLRERPGDALCPYRIGAPAAVPIDPGQDGIGQCVQEVSV
jgi:hypothetical protein